MADEHIDDIRNVREGDTVEITTTEGDTFEAECVGYSTEHADPRSGEIREFHLWEFSAVEHQPVVSITDGLKSSPDDIDFPIHKEMYDMQQEGGMGYISDLSIHGKMEA